jgi:hypothetical protein
VFEVGVACEGPSAIDETVGAANQAIHRSNEETRGEIAREIRA